MPGDFVEQLNEQEPLEGQIVDAPATPNDEVDSAESEPAAPEVAFSWQASEFVQHHKSLSWYVILWGGVLLLMAGAALLHLWLYIAVFLAMGVALVVYARMPPKTMMYELSSEGVQIDGKLFPFVDFRSFGVLPDDEWHSIDLEPAKRFSPRIVLLFDPEDLDNIVGHLELHLPRVDRRLDIIERATRFLRF